MLFYTDGTSLETLRPSQVVETALHHTSGGVRCDWCEVQLFFGAPPRPKNRWKALDEATSNVKFHQDRT